MKLTAKLINAIAYLPYGFENFHRRKGQNWALQNVDRLIEVVQLNQFGSFENIAQANALPAGWLNEMSEIYFEVGVLPTLRLGERRYRVPALYRNKSLQVPKATLLALGLPKELLGVPTIDYRAALSAIGTIEDAIALYPELKPAFEQVTGLSFDPVVKA